jgi:hypothetical protein
LILKSVFKGISRCIPTVYIRYFGQLNPLTLSLLPPIHQQFSVCIVIFICLHTCNGFWYRWLSVIVFPFPSSPKFYRVVQLVQICFSYKCVHDHAWFCVYVYLWIYLPHMWENMRLLSFWTWLTSLTCLPIPSIYQQVT